jgi:ArsR family transcriptional regulator
MEIITLESGEAVQALAALAQESRLAVFRALVEAGPGGLTPGDLATRLSIAANTLSFHLKELSYASLVSQERAGRNLIYRAEFARMNALLGYLSRNCCAGSVCEVNPESVCTTC